MGVSEKINRVNAVYTFFTIIYAFIIVLVGLLLGENREVSRIVISIMLLSGVIIVLVLLVRDYFRKKFKKIKLLDKRVEKLEELQKIELRLKKMEEKLIRHEVLLRKNGR